MNTEIKILNHKFNVKNKSFSSVYVDENMFCFFYGFENHDGKVKEPNILTKEFYYYYDYELLFTKVDGVEKKFLGEKIIFKKQFNEFEKTFFTDFFNSVIKCLEKNVWSSLLNALDDISEMLSVKNKDERLLKIKGYIGELLFVYKLITLFPDKLSIPRNIFNSYQKNRMERHDYKINPNFRIEVKSTSSEKMTFLIDAKQQLTIPKEVSLFYAFVKYNFVQKEMGINVENIFKIIQTKLEIKKSSVPNHLLMVSELYGFNDMFIDVDNVELYILNSTNLPDFSENLSTKWVTEIKYQLSMYDYLQNKNYILKEHLDELIQKLEE